MEISSCQPHRNALRALVPHGVTEQLGLVPRSKLYWKQIAPGVYTVQNLLHMVEAGIKAKQF